MSKCIFMKGIPWSWKSTYAKWLWIARFNRDDVRIETWEKEQVIEWMEKQFMVDNVGQDIVIDNTHMNPNSLNQKIEFAQSLWYITEVVDMRNMFTTKEDYLAASLHRNKWRDVIVPESVIYEMYLSEYQARLPYKSKIIICDIDWTVAEIEHRLHYIKWDIKDHDSFYDNVWGDTPILPVIDTINQLALEHTIIMVSGRRNQCYWETKKWLEKYWVHYDYILMRNSWDYRKDTEVKKSFYDKCLSKNDIFAVFDDRKAVVDMRRSLWLYVFDCNQSWKEF